MFANMQLFANFLLYVCVFYSIIFLFATFVFFMLTVFFFFFYVFFFFFFFFTFHEFPFIYAGICFLFIGLQNCRTFLFWFQMFLCSFKLFSWLNFFKLFELNCFVIQSIDRQAFFHLQFNNSSQLIARIAMRRRINRNRNKWPATLIWWHWSKNIVWENVLLCALNVLKKENTITMAVMIVV
jgi:hypothetical protein